MGCSKNSEAHPKKKLQHFCHRNTLQLPMKQEKSELAFLVL